MLIGDYEVYAPHILGGNANETEMLGAATWLWMQSPLHQNAPLIALSTLLLPVIKAEQYVLVAHNGQPVFYLSYAFFDEENEHRYLTQDDNARLYQQVNSGNRLWFLEWMTPFGHSRDMANLLRREIFPYHCYRALYHKGSERGGARVLQFRGRGVSRQQAAHWWHDHPLTHEFPARDSSR
ncbi:hemolysin-activating lysine-acyltransferase HlyC [Xenorhabdus mauleonii]|uniref:RTX toxin-activating lysine-acyltransferase n=1 Tax=Xenorhabdus mauleonii TaxID=351675 RepID=A0A1I3R3V7_9GAMM|nr:toxin-activating lysine-acyltransferase [Xenorhabdus mauleonii]PHM38645.1 hemolysin-activating lysine-acyltransferase HlyC [Xenorhabdus mauleonii]SFJ39936.1 cytolysin-activating lysine-acyltransferase [Xenorhabdus mauleonii]